MWFPFARSIAVIASWTLMAGIISPATDQLATAQETPLAGGDAAPPAHYQAARARLDAGEVDGAIALLNEAISSVNLQTTRHRLGEIPMRALLGECHRERGDLVAAMTNYQRCMAIVGQTEGLFSLIPWLEFTPQTQQIRQRERLGVDEAQSNRAGRNVMNLPVLRQPVANELWPSARQVVIARMPDHVFVGAPAGQWFLGDQTVAQSNAMSGLDVMETLRMLCLAAVRIRAIAGPAMAAQSPWSTRVLETTEIPGQLLLQGPDQPLSNLPLAVRSVLQSHRGDVIAWDVVERCQTCFGGTHELTPILRIASLRSMSVAWRLAERRGQIGDIPTIQQRVDWIRLARATADIAAAHEQFICTGDAMRMAVDEIQRLPADEPVRAALAGQLENDCRRMATTFQRIMPRVSMDLSISSAIAAWHGGDIAAGTRTLQSVDTMMRRGRWTLPRTTATAAAVRVRLLAAQQLAAQQLVTSSGSGGSDDPQRLAVDVADAWSRLREFARGPVAASTSHPMRWRAIQIELARRAGAATRPADAAGLAVGRNALDGLGLENLEVVYRNSLLRLASDLELDELDRLCRGLDPDPTIERVGMELARELGRSGEWMRRLDDRLARAARSGQVMPDGMATTGLGQWPVLADWRTACRLASIDDGFVDRGWVADETARAALRRLVRLSDIRHDVMGPDADWMRRRFEAELMLTAFAHPEPPRLTPRPIESPQRIDHGIADDIAIIAFDWTPERITGALRFDGQTTHWDIRDPTGMTLLVQQWIAAGGSATESPDDAVTFQQRTMDLTDRLFPPLCGVESISPARIVIVPDGPLWFVPMDWLTTPGKRDPNHPPPRWGDRVPIANATTPGDAFEAARVNRPRPIDDRRVLVWTRSIGAGDRSPPEPLRALSPVWWGQTVRHLIIDREVDPSRIRRPSGTPSRNPWSLTLVQACHPPLDSVIDLSDDFQSSRPEILFDRISRLQAGGVENVVVKRWPGDPDIDAILCRECALDLPATDFMDAWTRASAIALQQDRGWQVGTGRGSGGRMWTAGSYLHVAAPR